MTLPASARSQLPVGQRVCGDFVVERFVRQGTLAAVYTATGSPGGSPGDAGRYTVRLIPRRAGGSVPAFRREVERIQGIQHRAVAPLVAFTVETWGVVLVHRALGGLTLRERLRREDPIPR